MLKRLFSIITISLVLTGSFFSVYNINYPVYADGTTDGWTQVTTNEQLAEAFRYYCKSRDLTIEGSLADGLTSFTTNAFNGLCNTLGIDITALQANIKYKTDGNLGIKFLFNALSIDAYNRIFAQFLQDNDLEVGQSYDDDVIYSNEYFRDLDGYGAFVYVVPRIDNYTSYQFTPNKFGTTYKFDGYDVKNIVSGGNNTFTFNINSSMTNYTLYGSATYYGGQNNYTQYYLRKVTSPGSTLFSSIYAIYHDVEMRYIGNVAILKDAYTGQYAIGRFQTDLTSSSSNRYGWERYDYITTNIDKSNVNIYVNTNNTVINNNTYEGDIIINNNGTTGDDDSDPDIPDPNPGPTPDPPTIPDDGGWQDFSLPEMPNDWLIYGMEKKFPFDIPFNILFALSLLNHEPEIPKFQGDIDLQVCTWHYDIDLTPFDDLATILRKFEVLAFIIGLAILTKNLINWG